MIVLCRMYRCSWSGSDNLTVTWGPEIVRWWHKSWWQDTRLSHESLVSPGDWWHVSCVGGMARRPIIRRQTQIVSQARRMWSVNNASITRNKVPGIFWIIPEYSRLWKSIRHWGWAGTDNTAPSDLCVECDTSLCCSAHSAPGSRLRHWHETPGPPAPVSVSAEQSFVWRSAFTAHKSFIFQAFYELNTCIDSKAHGSK